MHRTILTLAIFALASPAIAAPKVTLTPESPLQGEPLMVSIAQPGPLAAATFDGMPLRTIPYEGARRIFIGIDINKKPGGYPLRLVFPNGEVVERTVTVLARERYEAPLGIPEKLGGNTLEAAEQVVSSLASENAVLAGLWTNPRVLWSSAFLPPLRTELVVTDGYGYNRNTVGSIITHKGTDFRAEEGTRVRAMNRGVVRLARTFRTYGKTIVVDHGLGLQTMYMHLSQIRVTEGQLVTPSQILGLSGQTGYAEAPHLHISVRLNSISIDPAKFLGFFGVQL
jgi:murein DD-endopeptidase MepM/ murein hydrolase activator NlpD